MTNFNVEDETFETADFLIFRRTQSAIVSGILDQTGNDNNNKESTDDFRPPDVQHTLQRQLS